MRDIFAKLKRDFSTITLIVGIRYFMRDLHFLTSITMPDLQTSDMRQMRK